MGRLFVSSFSNRQTQRGQIRRDNRPERPRGDRVRGAAHGYIDAAIRKIAQASPRNSAILRTWLRIHLERLRLGDPDRD
jgi:hypothetical protein